MNDNDKKLREILEKEEVPKELEPENVKTMLDEKSAVNKRKKISSAGRVTAMIAACAVICGGGIFAVNQKNMFDNNNSEKSVITTEKQSDNEKSGGEVSTGSVQEKTEKTSETSETSENPEVTEETDDKNSDSGNSDEEKTITELSSDTIINIPPRIRMATLYAVAASLPGGGRVANTCNRSEDYIGYSTKYGDAAGDFSPISDYLVTEVKQIGHEIEALSPISELIEKTPSDGLCGYTDEDKIGFTYATLDKYILTGVCEDDEIRAKIDRMHILNLHKLKTIPMCKKTS